MLLLKVSWSIEDCLREHNMAEIFLFLFRERLVKIKKNVVDE